MSHRVTLAFLGLHPERLRDLRAMHGTDGALVAAIRRGGVEGIEPGSLRSGAEQSDRLARSGATAVERGSPPYPDALETIGDPPEVLFVRGTIPEAKAVAVVGTRRCTAYGRSLARAFGAAIARAGWVLVSGLARGIDGEAHRGALGAGGRSVGVLGCGPDVVYPAEHRGLYREVVESGALLTEYPPGTRPHGWRFPPRNRIISGLSGAVVVVEATRVGGALVTAARAVEQGREVFAVPGDVDRDSSLGCNLLIRDGAVPVLGPEDLVEALSLVLGPPLRRPDEGTLPPTGLEIDVLAARLGIDAAAVNVWIGRREIAGTVRIEGTRVFPVD